MADDDWVILCKLVGCPGRVVATFPGSDDCGEEAEPDADQVLDQQLLAFSSALV